MNASIMVVEDQALIAMQLHDLLEHEGYAVSSFASEQEATRWLERFRPDAAILDITLADGDTTTLAESLESYGIPLAAYTGHTKDSPHCTPVFQRNYLIDKMATEQEVLAGVKRLLTST